MLISTIEPQVSLQSSDGKVLRTNLRPDENIFLVPDWKIVYETENLKNIVKICKEDALEYCCFDKNDKLIVKKTYKIEVSDIEMQLIDILSNVTAICDYDDEIQPIIFEYLAKESLEDGGTEISLTKKDDSKTKITLDYKIKTDDIEVIIKTKEFSIETKFLEDNYIETVFKYCNPMLKNLTFNIRIQLKSHDDKVLEYSIYDVTRIIIAVVSQREKDIFNNCFEE